MRVTFPHIGNMWVMFRGMANAIGFDVIVPPLNSQRTLSLGSRHSPETVCLPFKLTLGNMIEALENGADTIMTVGQYGPCRFGYYHKIQEPILRELGYEFEMLRQSMGLLNIMKYISNGAPWKKIVAGFFFGMAKMKAVEYLEQQVARVRAIERDKGQATQIFQDAIKTIDVADSRNAINRARQEHLDRLEALPTVPGCRPVRIGLTGEFFVTVDPFANMDIEVELGKLGVEVERPQTVLEWINFNPISLALGLHEKGRSHRAATPYLSHHVGGDGRQSVGEKVLHSRDWDGMVHLEPFGCVPETVARNIMPSTKEELPVLNLQYDEHTGKAGVISRLEAFVDMVRRKKELDRAIKGNAGQNRRKLIGRSR